MTNQTIVLLLALNLAHFLGDFTPLSKWFIAAKRYGKPIGLVLAHGAVNGALYGMVVGIIMGFAPFSAYGVETRHSLLLLIATVFAIETITHTLIDVLKGRIAHKFPIAENTNKQTYWTIMGADQLLHQAVLVFIVYLCFQF